MSAAPDTAMLVPRAITFARLLLAGAIWTLVAIVISEGATVRALEARLAALLAEPVTPGRSTSVHDVIVTGIGTHAVIGLQITNECTVELLIVPMLLLAGLIILFRRFSVIGITLGLLLGVGVVIVTNQIRIILIAYATLAFGQNLGYELTHKFIGSVVAIVGFSAGLLLMMRVVPRLINRSRT